MKAKLTFDLPEEQEEFREAFNGSKWRNVVWDMYQYLRSNFKYASDDTHEEFVKAMYECRDRLFEIMQDNGVDLEV